MKSIRDWAFSQLLSNSLVLSRPLSGSGSFFTEEPRDEVPANSGSTQNESMVTSQVPADIGSQEGFLPSQLQALAEDSSYSEDHVKNKKLDPLSRIEALQIKLFRLLQRLGQLPEDLMVAKVLYRMHLATLIQADESDLKRINLKSDRFKAVAAEQEAAGRPELDFSLKILVLGKTGVGKSATINSIFDQPMAITNAFRPGTDHIQEVVGTVNGITVTVVDTPGFCSSCASNMRRNRQTMLSIKRYIQKSPPDIVLYLERLDLISMGYSDFPLLKLITEVFGSSIWFNTILVMTHAASALPEGPNGFPVTYESYVTQCTDLLRHYIHQAVSDTRLENPVVLVENHTKCRTNVMGEKLLPNGKVWRSELLLLCVCTKVLGDANEFLGFQDCIELGPSNNTRLPSLPHLLSSILRHRSPVSTTGAEDDIDEYLLSDTEQEDEYDQLPPIRILNRSQFEKLSESQKKEYLDELHYRETLFLKKQLKEELRRRREKQLSEETNLTNDGSAGGQESSPDAVPLPDMAVPPSFDSDCHVHKYRCLVTGDQWLWRPVLDPHGWDHDVGFDGVNLETAVEVRKNMIASVSGQMSKDKQDFNIQSECAAAYFSPEGATYFVGLDVQSTGKDLIYTIHGNTKLRNLRYNLPGCGVSMTSFRKKYYFGAKLEDTLYIGNRLKFTMNAGRVEGLGQAAYGGSFEATLRGADYPVRHDKVSMTMTFLSFNKETVLSGGLQSEFRPTRGLRLSVNANLNSRKMGQVCIKTSSTEHMEIALLALVSIFRALCRRTVPNDSSPAA